MQHGIYPFINSMRHKRKLRHGAKYHVQASANRDELILGSSELKTLFLDIVKRAKEKYKFNIENLCLMGCYLQLIIQPLKGESLSRIMQWILSVFAMKYNKLHNVKGHVFYDRFKSTIIENFLEYVRSFTHIMETPVKASIVTRPEDYEFNGVSYLRKGIYEVIEPPDEALISVIRCLQ